MSNDKTMIDQAYEMANRYHKMGNIDRAEQLYKAVLERDSTHVDTLRGLSRIYFFNQNYQQVEKLLTCLIETEQVSAQDYYYLGMIKRLFGDHEAALECFYKSLEGDPNDIKSMVAVGKSLLDLSKISDSIEVFEKCLIIDSGNHDANYGLGRCYLELQEWDKSKIFLEISLKVNPEYAMTYCYLSYIELEQNHEDAAISYFNLALEKDAKCLAAYRGLATLYFKKDDYRGTLKNCHRYLKLDDKDGEIYRKMGLIYFRMGFNNAARRCFERARQYMDTPFLRMASVTCLPVFYDTWDDIYRVRQKLIDDLDNLLSQEIVLDKKMEICGTPFYLAYQGLDDKDIHVKIASWLSRVRCLENENDKKFQKPNGKIKLGILSSHLCDHTIGKLFYGLISLLPKDRFEITIFSLVDHPDTNIITNYIKSRVDHYCNVVEPIVDAVKVVEDAKCDILFYPDIGMDARSYTLALHRLAPIQCTTWGHPVTTGMETMDYFISSTDLDTEKGQDYYIEKLVRLNSSPAYYHRPKIPPMTKTRADFGFSDNDHIYVIPQSLQKMHPDFDPILNGILEGDPVGKIAILSGRYKAWNGILRRRLQKTIPQHLDRIIFLPQQKFADFCSLVKVSDVMLDPLHFGGGNTTYEGLFVGTPVVTLPSDFLKCRISYAICKAAGLDECIAYSPEEYVDVALRFGKDKDFRDRVKAKILDSHDLIYQDRRVVVEYINFFINAVNQL